MMTCARVREFNSKPPPEVSIELHTSTPNTTAKPQKTTTDNLLKKYHSSLLTTVKKTGKASKKMQLVHISVFAVNVLPATEVHKSFFVSIVVDLLSYSCLDGVPDMPDCVILKIFCYFLLYTTIMHYVTQQKRLLRGPPMMKKMQKSKLRSSQHVNGPRTAKWSWKPYADA